MFKDFRPTAAKILKLAYPVILGQLGIVLMGVADTIMVGDLGKESLAAVNQANNLFFMLSGLTFGVLFAISTLVSVKVGEKRSSEGYTIYQSGIWVSLLLFIIQFIIMSLLISQFHLLQQTPEVNAIAPGYLKIVIWSILPLLLFLNCRQYADGLGHTKVSMVLTFLGLGFNILFNWLFIYGNWGFQAMGVEGAAWATLLSRWIMTIMGMTYVRYSNLMKSYIIEGRLTFWETRKYTHEIWKIGIPIALQTFAEWACFALSGIMVGWFGNDPLAAHAVALNAASVTYMIVTGIATAGSIFTGNAFGERNYFKIKHLGQITLILILAFEIINAVLFIILNKPIAHLYRVEESVLPYILPLFFLAAIFQVADGIQAGAMALLRGVKDVRWASVISMVSYWAISLPLSYLLGVILEDGVYGVWLGLTIGLFVAAIFGVIRFYKNVNKWEVAI